MMTYSTPFFKNKVTGKVISSEGMPVTVKIGFDEIPMILCFDDLNNTLAITEEELNNEYENLKQTLY